MSKSLDILGDLVKSLNAEPKRRPAPVRRQKPAQPKIQYVKKSGNGGLIMDFGGNGQFLDPRFKEYENLMNRHGDPTQVGTATYQHESFNKALDDYVELGEHGYDQKMQREDASQIVEAQQNHELVKAKYAHTTTSVGGENITAQSETDAAIMEMFKSGELE